MRVFLHADYVRDTKAENMRGAKTEKSLIFRPFSNGLQRGLSSKFSLSTTFPTQYVWHDQTPNFSLLPQYVSVTQRLGRPTSDLAVVGSIPVPGVISHPG